MIGERTSTLTVSAKRKHLRASTTRPDWRDLCFAEDELLSMFTLITHGGRPYRPTGRGDPYSHPSHPVKA